MLLVMGTKLKLANRNEEFVRGEHKPLAAGIHDAVLIMRRAGIEPFESHQGGPGHASDMPTIKYEEVYLRAYASVTEARASIGRHIDRFYNARRPHSSLDRQTPDEAYFNALQPIPVAA